MERAKTPRFDQDTLGTATKLVFSKEHKLDRAQRKVPQLKAQPLFWPLPQPAKGQEIQPKHACQTARGYKTRVQSRKINVLGNSDLTGELPIRLNEWFEGQLPARCEGLGQTKNPPQDSLGACAKRPPAEFRNLSKRCRGTTMHRPMSAATAPIERQKVYIRPIKQKPEQMPKPMGRKAIPAPQSQTQKPLGLRIIRDASGGLMKDQRSGVIKFTDLTGEKRDFSHLPDYIGREDPNCWPGWKGYKPDYDQNGKFQDYNVKANGGVFTGGKYTSDTSSALDAWGQQAAGYTSCEADQAARQYEALPRRQRGRTAYQGILSLS